MAVVNVIDSLKVLLIGGQPVTVSAKKRFTTAEQAMRKNEAENKWHRLANVRKMFNCLLSDRSEKGRARFTILYYLSRWSYAGGTRINGDRQKSTLHTINSLIDEITWLEEKDIYRCVKELVKFNWLQHQDGYLRLTPLGYLHFQHILVTEAEDFTDDFLLSQVIENVEKRCFLGTTNQSTIASFASALQILEGCRNKLNRVLNSLEPGGVSEASSKAEIYLDHMRRFRNRIIDLGILGEDDPLVRDCYNLLGEVANLIQDVRRLKDKLDAGLRGQLVIHYEPEELDRTIAGMLGQSSLEKAAEELGNWLDGAGTSDLPFILDTASLIPALECVHCQTMAMQQKDSLEKEHDEPTRRLQPLSTKTAMDFFLEDLLARLQADIVLTTSKIIPHEQKGQTLLNLSRIKWLAGYSADLRRKYGGQVFTYTPLRHKTGLPEFNIEFMDDAEVTISIRENKADEQPLAKGKPQHGLGSQSTSSWLFTEE